MAELLNANYDADKLPHGKLRCVSILVILVEILLHVYMVAIGKQSCLMEL